MNATNDLVSLNHPELEEVLQRIELSLPSIEELTKTAEFDLETILQSCDQMEIRELEIPGIEPIDWQVLRQQSDIDLQSVLASLVDQGLLENLPEPEPYVRPDPSLTAHDAAEWMRREIDATGFLDHDYAVSHLWRYFGQHFTRLNDAGNNVIALEVLKEFAKRTPHVVWSRHEKQWRYRYPADPQGRLVE